MTMTKAVVVFSGGQDSTTCLYWAKERFDEIEAVSFFYGQRHRKELDGAAEIAALAGVPHHVLDITVLSKLSASALVNGGQALMLGGGHPDAACPGGLPTSFVPGRNALFLTLATAKAIQIGAKDIVTGVCQTDYSGYPDCREPFIKALELALNLGMPSGCGPITIHTPMMNLTKAETVKMASNLGTACWAALGRSLTCYNGQRPGCGTCGACDLRAKGFAEAGYSDPAEVRP